MKTVTKESAAQAYQVAPQLIKNIIDSAKTVSIIVEIGKKHNLHIDIFGKLAQLNSYLLLGLINPDEVFQELIETGIPDKDAREIVTEINQKIFVPLREEMRKGATTTPPPARSAAPPVAAPRVNMPPPSTPPPPVAELPKYGSQTSIPVPAREVVLPLNTVIIPANPRMPPRPPEINVSVPINAPLEPAPPKPAPPSPAEKPAAPPPPSANQRIVESATTDSSRLLEDHEESHINISDKVQAISSPTISPSLRVFPPRPASGFGPPPNLPGAFPPPDLPKAEPQAQPAPTSRAVPPPVPAEPYSADPYREPIE